MALLVVWNQVVAGDAAIYSDLCCSPRPTACQCLFKGCYFEAQLRHSHRGCSGIPGAKSCWRNKQGVSASRFAPLPVATCTHPVNVTIQAVWLPFAPARPRHSPATRAHGHLARFDLKRCLHWNCPPTGWKSLAQLCSATLVAPRTSPTPCSSGRVVWLPLSPPAKPFLSTPRSWMPSR